MAYQVIRLCISTGWSDDAKAKAQLTPERMRSELAKILFQINGLKRTSAAGDAMATLELLALTMTLDMFENNMFRDDILGVDIG